MLLLLTPTESGLFGYQARPLVLRDNVASQAQDGDVLYVPGSAFVNGQFKVGIDSTLFVDPSTSIVDVGGTLRTNKIKNRTGLKLTVQGSPNIEFDGETKFVKAVKTTFDNGTGFHAYWNVATGSANIGIADLSTSFDITNTISLGDINLTPGAGGKVNVVGTLQATTLNVTNGGTVAGPLAGPVSITGERIDTEASNYVGALDITQIYGKADSLTKTHYGVKVYGDIQASGINSNGTFRLLDVDTTNFNTTGVSTDMLRVGYGGVEQFRVASDGYTYINRGPSSADGEIQLGALSGTPTYAAIYMSLGATAKSGTNYAITSGGTETYLNHATGGTVGLRVNNSNILTATSSGITATQPVTIANSGGVLKLAGSGSGSHAYTEFYPDAIAGGRKAYLGFASDGATALSMVNQITNGNISLVPGSGGNTLVGGKLLLAGGTDIDNNAASAINIGTTTATSIAIGRSGQTATIGGNLTVTSVAQTPILFMDRSTAAQRGIQWWNNSTFTMWTEYMAQAASTLQGPRAQITAPTGTLVTSYALRSAIENITGYGWTWESGTSNTTTPSIVAELSSNTGNFRNTGTFTAGSTITSSSASGSIAFAATQGARLHLGNTGRYLSDDGSEFVSTTSMTLTALTSNIGGTGNAIRILSTSATSGTTTQDSPLLTINAAYWNGTASVQHPFSIQHDMLSTGPTSRALFKFNGTDVASITGTGGLLLTAGQGVDTLSAGALSIGNTTATSLSIGRSGITTSILGSVQVAQTIDTAGSTSLDLGTFAATAVNLGRGGAVTTVAGSTINLSGGTSASGTITSTVATGSDALVIGSSLASSGSPLQDSARITLNAQYWSGFASTLLPLNIYHDVTNTSPLASRAVFQINGAEYFAVNTNATALFGNAGPGLIVGNNQHRIVDGGSNFLDIGIGSSTNQGLRMIVASIAGTNDMFFQIRPSSTSGYGYLESFDAAGMVLGTGNATDLIFRPNRTERARLSNAGVFTVPGSMKTPALDGNSGALSVGSGSATTAVQIGNVSSVTDLTGASSAQVKWVHGASSQMWVSGVDTTENKIILRNQNGGSEASSISLGISDGLKLLRNSGTSNPTSDITHAGTGSFRFISSSAGQMEWFRDVPGGSYNYLMMYLNGSKLGLYPGRPAVNSAPDNTVGVNSLSIEFDYGYYSAGSQVAAGYAIASEPTAPGTGNGDLVFRTGGSSGTETIRYKPNGDISIKAGSTGSVRTINLGEGASSGNNSRYQFIDSGTAMQSGFGNRMQIYSYHNLELYGRQGGAIPSFAAGSATDRPVIIQQEAWTAVTFQNSWVNYDATNYASCAYMMDANGFVHLRGLIKNGTVGAAAFTLPSGYRPSRTLHFPLVSNAAFGWIRIDTAGTGTAGAVVIGGGNNTWVSLDGINFPITNN